MEQVKLTNRQARHFILLKQGLVGNYKFIKEQGVCDYIKEAGCIQFDPIDVCGKNAELVLQSRVDGFSKEMLHKLLYIDRKLIDYFDKNMSIFSIKDWKYFSRQRAKHEKNGRSREQVNNVMDKIKEIIKAKGFVSSKDLSFKEQVDWYWSPATLSRAALETLYFQGDLILNHKKGTIKYYSLAHEYIPEEILNAKDPNLTDEEHWKWRILRRIGAVGLLWNKSSDAWLGIDGLKSSNRNEIFQELLAEKKIIEVIIENISDAFYCLSEDKDIIDLVLDTDEFQKRVEFIAPLDNMIWDRRLIKDIFNFEYKWEIYTPIAERKYGYYILPVLYGDTFIGRIEVINDKKLKQLVVKNFWFEDNIIKDDVFEDKIQDCLNRFANFNNCESIRIDCEISSSSHRS
ncbi:winged helix DNA-binding domain-containing protein [Tissierella carlieri]|uniref:Winged helix DNA-binding domain-containing protein n=1 Tax=Tissierella carlieri TaxID=689904 RepID=A0ABT1SD04_9FIRM|nr:winged helix DNA-binding domain-containing protein [Tissierella carlieri]MCQ4924350.1 winged helix DNA-binding domain-containing protein [Tissierella carlieri]